MSAPFNPARIAEARARCEAATKHVEQCVSEQGHNGILWTLFEGAPFSSERIASFAKAEDARAFIRSQLDLPDALDALEEAMALLGRVGKEPLLDGLWDEIKAFLTKHGVQP